MHYGADRPWDEPNRFKFDEPWSAPQHLRLQITWELSQEFFFFSSADEIFSCGTVFKVKEIAAHYKMGAPDQYCWPVLLSKKKGDAALALCPEHDKHGGIKSKMHVRPAKFDLDHVYKNFTRKPTKAENEAANWVPAKRGKA